MAVNTPTIFGNRQAPAAAPAAAERPKADIWLNLGVTVQVDLPDGTKETKFVSLPMGLPLDTMDKLPTNSRNLAFGQFQAARNDLLQQFIDQAKNTLKPGEEMFGVIEFQLRRVDAPAAEPAIQGNPFATKLQFTLPTEG